MVKRPLEDLLQIVSIKTIVKEKIRRLLEDLLQKVSIRKLFV
jgi:hypothetical protein